MTHYTSAISPPSPFPAGSGAKQYVLDFDEISRLIKIQYPYGGYTRYDYDPSDRWRQVMNNVQCSWTNNGEVHRKYECSSSGSSCTEQTTTYAPVLYDDGFGSQLYNASMTITDPLGDQETHLFSTTSPFRTNPEETDVQYKNPAGTVLRTVHSDYPAITSSSSGGYVFDWIFPTKVTTTLSDSAPSKSTSTTYTYQPYSLLPNYSSAIINNATEIDTTDYNGAVTRKVTQQWEPASAFTSSPLILDRLQSRTTTDAAGSISSTVSYGYDTSGNVTSKTETGTNLGSLVTQYMRNSYGEVISVTDPNNYVTTIGYADAWSSTGGTCGIATNISAYPTSVTNALSQETNYTYNACTGTVATVKDPNNVTDSYSYDPLGRVLCETITGSNSAMAAQKCNSYVDSAPSSITESVNQSPDPTTATNTAYDGFGRVYETHLSNNSYTWTNYDPLGRVASVTVPSGSATDVTSGPGTAQYFYDALGRKTEQIDSDGVSTQWWGNNNNVVTFTDENSHQWQRTSDALGRLTQVVEPGSLTTNYTYDALNNLRKVNQLGNATNGDVPRTRTFNYDALSRLLCASNPENATAVCPTVNAGYVAGTTGYAYDSDGNVQSRTDARGVTTKYAYDKLNRLYAKTYMNAPAGTLSNCYQYDSSSVTDGIGRLAAEWTQAGGCSSTPPAVPAAINQSLRQYGAYDAMGRAFTEVQCTAGYCTSAAVPSQPSANCTRLSNATGLQYCYDYAGNLLAYSSGLTTAAAGPQYPQHALLFSQTFDAAARLNSVTSSWSDTTHPQSLFSSPVYTPVNALSSWLLGTQLTTTRTYDARLRVTGQSSVQ